MPDGRFVKKNGSRLKCRGYMCGGEILGTTVLYATTGSASDVYKEVIYTSAQPLNQNLGLRKMTLLARCERTGCPTANI